jgi:glycosyltransferase involved in cell wall biosynthesis
MGADGRVLTVVVPTHNGAGRILPLLRALARQTIQSDLLEVLIIDNGSVDASAQKIGRTQEFKAIAKRYNSTRIVSIAEPGLTNARIAGVLEADGDVVLFLDDDAEPNIDCCEETLKAFLEPRVGVVFGRIYPKYAHEPHYSIRKREGILAINHRLGSESLVWRTAAELAPTIGVALAVRKSAFIQDYPWRSPERVLPDRVGTQTLSGGDIEIGQYLAESGWWRVYQPGIIVHHAINPYRLTPLRFCRLIVGIERSHATLEDKFRVGPSPPLRRTVALCEFLFIVAMAPVWFLSRDAVQGWLFALVSRGGRLLGSYRQPSRCAAATSKGGHTAVGSA